MFDKMFFKMTALFILIIALALATIFVIGLLMENGA